MIITINGTGDTCRIAVEGDIDERAAEEFKARLREIKVNRKGRVYVDFRGLTHIGSAGIGKLLVLYKDLAVSDATLNVINVPRNIFRLLCEMKLDAIFTIEEAKV
jgi:anti-anti-sigma factor